MRLLRLCIGCSVFVLAAIGQTPDAAAEDRLHLVESLDLQVPVAPTIVRVAGKRRVAYELHVTNFARVDVKLNGLEVLDAERGAQLAVYRDADLTKKLARPGRQWNVPQPELLASGMRAIVYLWLTFEERAAVPSKIVHRVDLDLLQPAGRQQLSVHGADVFVRNDAVAVLGPPLRGGPWVALYDPSMMGGHRTAIYTIDGRARIPARFAVDWVRLGEQGGVAHGDQAKVSNWHGYGADVLAVADGTIVEANDDLPSTARLDESRGPMALELASGNYVTLDMGDGRYVFYEHLKSGSVKVTRGDRVERGDVIAQLGNSGSSSSGPHLHFHVADANSTLAAEGLPYVFESFEVIGAFDAIGDFSRSGGWKSVPASEGGIRSMELPGANVVVRFR